MPEEMCVRQPRRGWGRASAVTLAAFLSCVAVLAVAFLGTWSVAPAAHPLGDLFGPDVLTLDGPAPAHAAAAQGARVSAPADDDDGAVISVSDWTETKLSSFH